MAGPSEIEWTDVTWNPVRGCVKVSPGCKFCYAETFAERWRGVPGHAYEQGFDPRLAPDQLEAPLRWSKPRRVFVNSMSDLFGDFVPDSYLLQVLDVCRRAGNLHGHTFQILTKRAERMRRFGEALHWTGKALKLVDPNPWPYFRSASSHVHLGVSVEDRRFGLPRVEELRCTPAALRFLSIEPLLEELGPVDLTGIGWVIIGGESGNDARPCNLAWIRDLVRQCDEQRVPVFVKQIGARPVGAGAPIKLRSRKGGDLADMPADLAGRRAFPEVRR